MTNSLSKGAQLASENFGSWLDFHQAMIEKRIELGISQTEMAELMGVAKSAISKFESLGVNPRSDTLLAYAQALEVKIKFSVESD